jgi:hypothetical protein
LLLFLEHYLSKLGWMISGMAINPFNSDEMIYGTGATIYGTENLTNWDDSTKSDVVFKSVAADVEECAVLALAVPPTTGTNSDVKLIAGVGDIGGFTFTDLNIPTQMFLTPRFTSTSSIDFAELDPDKVIRVGTASTDLYEKPVNIGNSTDGGKTFGRIDSSLVQAANVIGFGKAAPDSAYPAIYMTGTCSGKSGIYQSIDKGTTWTRINNDNYQYGALNFAITGDMRNYGIVYVATNGRGIVYNDITSGIRLIGAGIKNDKEFNITRREKILISPEDASFSLFNVRGMLVRRSLKNGTQSIINLNGLCPGLYVARLGQLSKIVNVH